ncbi:HD domain-containing protein [Actinoplanes sp. NPDC051494]|uniref:HD domain-containing protein n=1 Tax=Actinoplanes sp. NPDC051494 TaxID=3363907 RepID=UPI0037AF6257
MSGPIPTDAGIRALHERFAPTREAFDLVYEHCEIVCRIAEQIIDRTAPDVDVALVRAGCLLHDIGVYALFLPSGDLDGANYIRHGVLGRDMLRSAGLAERVCRFCSCHTGVGVTRADIERQALPLPPGDYTATTDEERLVMYADKFHSKRTPPVFVSATSYQRSVLRFGDDKVAVFAAMVEHYGEPDLAPLAAQYGQDIR